MKLFRTFAVIALAATIAFPGTAEAKKKKKSSDEEAAATSSEESAQIEDCGIAEFDNGVFNDARGIHETLDGIKADIASANASLNEALGLATDAPLDTALADLKTKAEGKISVAMEGTKPTLSASEAVPENVQAGIDAVNAMIGTISAAKDKAMGLSDQAAALAASAAALPGQVNKDTISANGLKVTQLGSVLSTVKSNVGVIGDTPDRITAIGEECANTLQTVTSTFQ